MMRSKLALGVAIVAAAAVTFTVRQVNAATQTSNLTVTATVAANCVITSGTLAFGAYDPLVANASAALDGSGTFTIACNKGTPYAVGLGLGSNANGTTRRMAGSGDFLEYELYTSTARTTVWGDANPARVTGTTTSRAPVTLTVYGRIPGGQDVGVDSYTDTVTSTIEF